MSQETLSIITKDNNKVASCGTALIADDELSNRIILKALLKKYGYQVIEAVDGADAIRKFQAEDVNIVFMDVMMPVMDGYEAAAQIKTISGNTFIPILFLTAVTDEHALAHCIEVGGDDFLTKPINHTLLKAKIKSMERIRDLHKGMQVIYSRMQRDEEIAEKVFSDAVLAGNVAFEHINALSKPADIFSGDILLTSFSPSNDLHILLGDFTGHGLAAALGALPVSEVFRSMTAKGFSPAQILNTINQKLSSLLPTGMFLAAQFVSISHELDHIIVCNCGMPDFLILNGADNIIKHRVQSTGLPLGIDSSITFQDAVGILPINEGDSVLLATDGVSEARNPAGELFGQTRIEEIISQHNNGCFVLDDITSQLEAFCGDAPQDDDITAAEIPCIKALFPKKDIPLSRPAAEPVAQQKQLPASNAGGDIDFSIILRHGRLKNADPIPLLISYIKETVGLEEHRVALFTVLTELYVNALDHGVLGLDSKLKSSTDGFSNYMKERENRLNTLTSGQIQIELKIRPHDSGGQIIINMEDSGSGFDIEGRENKVASESEPSGRGLILIEELCESLEYHSPGNKAVATYSWSDN